jgi:hypothetical protein
MSNKKNCTFSPKKNQTKKLPPKKDVIGVFQIKKVTLWGFNCSREDKWGGRVLKQS